MIKVTLKGGTVKEYDGEITAIGIAQSIGAGLAKAACAAEINGEYADLRTVIEKDSNVAIFTFDDDYGRRAFRHTASHIMAQAIKRLYPDVRLAIGPSIENGFYYDLDTDMTFTDEALRGIEAEMKKIVKEDLPIERFYMDRNEAVKYFEEKNEPYKVELINDLPLCQPER